MVKRILYKGKEIPMSDITVELTDCMGDFHTGDIERYASDYAGDCVAEAEAGEGW